ncbi:aldo/keto reductase [Microlunatus phosphovorus NM-1]|uniref:Aldo/keto reductase n=1 Tax=Microlunatus phosphovorus (strain ATCC 700054 / DSM 10555 / JCM 9379 / NBRC 101784 / NCIMB 13414 / VKM Ac-1990 / NM-1) TaxID=1032480 RepID=F5XKW3_MICPN|nr:aldo/keto reductase [Microlunatus phosphovorus]BAK33651.1 aldo/keto reductase [Microlunatus phosphovorus NM-1]
MIYAPLGPSGLVVSTVGLGCNNFGARMADEDVPAVVHAAIDAGVTLFDTADIYGNAGGSETLLGKALRGRRDQVVVATKFGMDMRGANGPDWGARGSRRYIRIAVENSLRRLGTDWIDLYQYHEPDGVTPIEETLGALTELVTEGKVRYIGSSNLAGWQVIDADWIAKSSGYEAFISAQNEYSWLNRSAETELVPALEHTGLGLLPFFPLARGLLTGKYRRGESAPQGSRLARAEQSSHLSDAAFDKVEALSGFAAERGITLLDIAIGGLAAMPSVASVIAGATKVSQIESNVVAGQWQPTPEDLQTLVDLTA